MLARSSVRSGAVARPARLQRTAVVGPLRPLPFQPAPNARTVTCQGLFGLGLPELAVIAGVTALIFGPSKLPELGKSLGKTAKSFQTAAKEFSEELKAGMSDDAKAVEAPKDKEAEEPKKP